MLDSIWEDSDMWDVTSYIAKICQRQANGKFVGILQGHETLLVSF